jgi:hypothetical protein
MLTAVLIVAGIGLPVGLSLVPTRVWATHGLTMFGWALRLIGLLCLIGCVFELVMSNDPWVAFSWALAVGYLVAVLWRYRVGRKDSR